MLRASFPYDSGQKAVNTEAGVAVRNGSHIVMFDKLVFLEWISLAGKRCDSFLHLPKHERELKELRQCGLTSGDDHII